MRVNSRGHASTRRARNRGSLIAAVILLVVGATATPAEAHSPSVDVYTYGEGCSGARKDPVTAFFYGPRATVSYLQSHIQYHLGWGNAYLGSTQYIAHSGYCTRMAADTASGTFDRFHLRFFNGFHTDTYNGVTWHYVYSEPHHEQYKNFCPNTPFHHVDAGAPTGSGFQQGKARLYSALAHHYTGYTYFGNTASLRQCDGSYASSDGYVYSFKMD